MSFQRGEQDPEPISPCAELLVVPGIRISFRCDQAQELLKQEVLLQVSSSCQKLLDSTISNAL